MYTKEEALTMFAEAAVACEASTDCPAALSVAQAILESGWGRSMPGNNCFGIKRYVGCYGTQLLNTHEWFTDPEAEAFRRLDSGRTATLVMPSKVDAYGRKLYAVKDLFATFPDLTACFTKHAGLFLTHRYLPFMAAYKIDRDLTKLVRGIGPVYATAPNYADSVLDLIRNPQVQAAIATVSTVTGTVPSVGTQPQPAN